MNEQDQVLCQPIWHINRLHDSGHGFIMPAEIIDLSGQIVLNRVLNTSVEKFRQRVIEMIPFTEKDTIRAQAREDKPCVLDQDPVKAGHGE